MTVVAVMRDGAEVLLAARHGTCRADVIRELTSRSLTGSAVALAEAELETLDGRMIRYSDVNSLEDSP